MGDTPKRVRTFIRSPPGSGSDQNAILLSPPPASHQWDPNHQLQSVQYFTDSLSPAGSSCDSPEYSVINGGTPARGVIAHQYGSGGSGGTVATPPVVHHQHYDRENRRGRPRSEALTTLMIEGSTSPSAIKCGYCNRVFPREKSLQAHLRTHTGERPYPCDYPGCTRAFTQSGQLKTHQRLHTGERPFMCSATSCQQRFTHANRHCPDHPYDQLKRCDDFVIQTISEQNNEVMKWLEKYRLEKEDRTPTRKTPKRTKLPDNNENAGGGDGGSSAEYNQSSISPSTPSNPYKSRKGLMVELDMNAGLVEANSPLAAPKMKARMPKQIQWTDQPSLSQGEESGDDEVLPATSTFNPKKRWLREAAWQDDLARPLEQINGSLSSGLHYGTLSLSDVLDQQQQQQLNEHEVSRATTSVAINDTHQLSNRYVNPNEMRPTVLMVASKHKTMPLIDQHDTLAFMQLTTSATTTETNLDQSFSPNTGNRKWLGALALMELATNDEINLTQAHKTRNGDFEDSGADSVRHNNKDFIRNNNYPTAQYFTEL